MEAQNTVAERFTIQRQGKTVVLFAGLLDLAHRQGLKSISTELLQIPSEDNAQTAICFARVETERGTYTGIGDASPANVARAMLTCTIRLAETRAKARALRDATNIGVVAFEELDEDGQSQDEPTRAASAPPAARAPAHPPTVGAPTFPPPPAMSGDPRPLRAEGDLATPAQVRFIEKLAAEGNIPTEGLLKLCQGYGFSSPEKATRAQATKLIDVLKHAH